jgi:hypothetical protein
MTGTGRPFARYPDSQYDPPLTNPARSVYVRRIVD